MQQEFPHQEIQATFLVHKEAWENTFQLVLTRIALCGLGAARLFGFLCGHRSFKTNVCQIDQERSARSAAFFLAA